MSRFQQAVCLIALLGASDCGGSQASSRHPSSPEGARGGGDTAGGSSDSDATSSEPSVDSYCNDGTCAVCGEGICPTGYYCDESDEPACSWLPTCGASPDCACISRRLGDGCTCESRDGGLFVKCG